MKALFEQLKTVDFQAYHKALSAIRNQLDAGAEVEDLDDADIFFLLRPYCWFLHNPGFQDIMDSCEDAMQVLQAHTQELMEESNPIMGNEFLAVAKFLASYIDKGTFDPTEWRMLFASPEVATSTTAKKYAEQLQSIDSEASASMIQLQKTMQEIEGAKHSTYWILRHLGADYSSFLTQMIHSFPSGDQSYILHAMDAFVGDERAIAFYEHFIEKTKYEQLKEEAQGYLERIEET